MKIITATAPARAALAGNPSDGYYGKTLSLAIHNFKARVVVYEWHQLEIIPPPSEGRVFASLDALAEDVGRNGYYGAIRLVKAALKKFHQYCEESKVELPAQNFSIRYETNVPRGVGLAGSSAIITATFRALMQFFAVPIPREIMANWILSVERDELRIQAGLQDRVAQVYEGLTLMDFDRAYMEEHGHGLYRPLDPLSLPPVYLAYQTSLAEPSDVVHNNLRARYDAGDVEVVGAMKELCSITDRAAEALTERKWTEFARAIDDNFEVRRAIMAIAPGHQRMVDAARRCGASANFAGSGGAIIGTCNGASYDDLRRELGELGCRVVIPQVQK
ncbi:GHMP kinase [bacterium]|nr:MAG: GHMP kinase [bacterium]